MATYSFSRLGTYEDCPCRYKLTYIDKVPVEVADSIEAFVGSTVHASLEHLYSLAQAKRVLSQDELVQDFDERWRASWSDEIRITRPELTASNWHAIGEDCLRRYYDRYQPLDSGTVIGLEERFQFPLDATRTLTGLIDRLMKVEDGVFEVHDYKTSAHLPTPEEAERDVQAGLYALAVRHRFPRAKEVPLVWHYLRFDEEIRTTRSLEELEALRQDLLRVIRKIESSREFPPNETALCGWCQYVELCPARGHRLLVEKLPRNRFLNEPGVRLVDRLAELEAELREGDTGLKAEIGEVEEALVAYATEHNLTVVIGSAEEAIVDRRRGVAFPRKEDDGREELEDLLRRNGLWDEVSDLSLSKLAKLVGDAEMPTAVLDQITAYGEETEGVSVRLRRRRADPPR